MEGVEVEVGGKEEEEEGVVEVGVGRLKPVEETNERREKKGAGSEYMRFEKRGREEKGTKGKEEEEEVELECELTIMFGCLPYCSRSLAAC